MNRITQISTLVKLLDGILINGKTQQTIIRNSTHYRSGALKPKPHSMPLGLVGVACTVIPGLFVGAAISKHMANFLEENELFVPADDDDDDDD